MSYTILQNRGTNRAGGQVMMTSVEHCSGKIIVNGKEIIIDQPYR